MRAGPLLFRLAFLTLLADCRTGTSDTGPGASDRRLSGVRNEHSPDTSGTVRNDHSSDTSGTVRNDHSPDNDAGGTDPDVAGTIDAAAPDAAAPDAAGTIDAPASGVGGALTLHAARISGDHAPIVDGAPDRAWSSAPALRFDTDWTGRPTGIVTTVRALWSPDGLYVRWELDAAGLATDRSRPIDVERVDLYEEDCVELFLAPDPAVRTRYAEIELGPYGHFFDLWIDRSHHGPGDASWSAHLRIGTTQDPDGHHAVIEAAITAPELVAALAPNATLPIGLFRMEGLKPRHYLAAFPTHTPRPKFHVPSAFGTLILDP